VPALGRASLAARHMWLGAATLGRAPR
jgi:hypothetical protein